MNIASTSLVPALGWVLIDFLWQGALIGLASAIALMLLRNARPQTRYLVSCAALALCLLLPLAGLLKDVRVVADSANPLGATTVQLDNIADRGSLDRSSAGPSAIDFAPIVSWQSSLQSQLPWIVALWSIGTGLLAARMAMGMMWVARAGSTQGQTHPRWQRRLDRMAVKLGVECQVRLRVVAELATPVAAGCWKPVVLVPAALIANMPLDLLEALLAHELAHIRRHDFLVNLIQCAIEALLFYHPVVWWLSRRIRIEREQIADDLAARALGEPRRLALALHELDRFQQQLQRADAAEGVLTTSLLPAANGGHLMSRIQRLIRPSQHALSWNIALPIIGLAAACMAVYAHDSAPGTAVAAAAEVPVATATPANQSAPAVPATPAVASVAATPAVSATASRTALQARFASDVAKARVVGAATRVSAAVVALSTTPIVVPAVHVRTVLASAGDSHQDAYAIVHGNDERMTMSADSRDLPAIERAKQHVHGDFVWVRRDGTTYVVQDPMVMAAIESSWAAAEALGKQMDVLGKQMDEAGKPMEALGKQMDALSHRSSPAEAEMEKSSGQMTALGSQQEALGAQMEALGGKMELAKDDATRASLQAQMETLEAKMKPLERQMEELGHQMDERGKQMEAEQKPMEELGHQMDAAGKPMEALGKQMDALGKQEEALSHDAERKSRALIDEAIRNGKAVRADSMHLD